MPVEALNGPGLKAAARSTVKPGSAANLSRKWRPPRCRTSPASCPGRW